MNIAVFSGELSGDLIGGALVEELKSLLPEVSFWGLGSRAMSEAGVELLADSASWGAISVTEALSKVPRLLFDVMPRVKRELALRQPAAVVVIDFGAFNVRVARYAKSLGLKVCYYFPPGAWRRTGARGGELAHITDVLAVPFPWAVERYQRLGANAVYVGHPLLERVAPLLTREQFTARFGMDVNQPIIGMLPGSRHHEVSHLMPAMVDAARLMYAKEPGAQFVVGVAPSISEEMMGRYLTGHADLKDRLGEIWHEFAQEAGEKVLKPVARTATALQGGASPGLVTAEGVIVPTDDLDQDRRDRGTVNRSPRRSGDAPPPTVLTKGLTYDVMAHSDVLLICSGTATLEATVFATPMVVLYRGSKLMEFEYRLRGIKRKIPHIGLPNILADRRIVPELIQDEATPQAIADAALTLLNDIEARQAARRDLSEVRTALGEPGASARTAELVAALIREAAPPPQASA